MPDFAKKKNPNRAAGGLAKAANAKRKAVDAGAAPPSKLPARKAVADDTGEPFQ